MQSFLVIIVNCCSYDSNNSHYAVAGVQCTQYDQGWLGNGPYNGWTTVKRDAQATQICAGSSAEVSSNKLNLLCFPGAAPDETQPWDGFTCQK